MNEDIMKQAGFSKEVERVKMGLCPSCNKRVDMTQFRDDISLQEHGISGLCQKCQDEFFNQGV